MKQSLGLVGVEAPGTAVVPGIFTEDTPTRPREWWCQHCGKLNTGRVLASFNGAPLCLPPPHNDEANCYRLVSTLNHNMPCDGDPCPGEVSMEHAHGEEDEKTPLE